jgi:transketolase
MRNVFCQSLLAASADPAFVFLTGDLGFMALEPLRQAMGERFINAGVAEQNMVSVAAGLARQRLKPWCYSIAPFIYARSLEQIRNDVCLHNLGVVLVGNGGGYGYGVMGVTHHSVEDYGTIGCQPGIRSYIPAFDGDVARIIAKLIASPEPAYLRLGLSEQPKDLALPAYAPWRKLTEGDGATLLVCGPLVGGIVTAALASDFRPAIWLLGEMPIEDIPAGFIDDLKRSNHLVMVEEHVAAGGAGQAVAARLMGQGHTPRRFTHLHASATVPHRYGSQKFHRTACGIDPQSVLAACGQGPKNFDR